MTKNLLSKSRWEFNESWGIYTYREGEKKRKKHGAHMGRITRTPLTTHTRLAIWGVFILFHALFEMFVSFIHLFIQHHGRHSCMRFSTMWKGMNLCLIGQYTFLFWLLTSLYLSSDHKEYLSFSLRLFSPLLAYLEGSSILFSLSVSVFQQQKQL